MPCRQAGGLSQFAFQCWRKDMLLFGYASKVNGRLGKVRGGCPIVYTDLIVKPRTAAGD